LKRGWLSALSAGAGYCQIGYYSDNHNNHHVMIIVASTNSGSPELPNRQKMLAQFLSVLA
jgi:hypothetical protein